MSDVFPDIYTEAELAEILSCAPSTIQEHARSGSLPGLLFGTSGYVFPRAALMQVLNAKALEQAAERSTKAPHKAVVVSVSSGRRLSSAALNALASQMMVGDARHAGLQDAV